jgi:hypothetical protein
MFCGLTSYTENLRHDLSFPNLSCFLRIEKAKIMNSLNFKTLLKSDDASVCTLIET